MADPTFYVPTKTMQRTLLFLWSSLLKIKNKRDEKSAKIIKEFGDPVPLSRLYVIPNCQEINPADEIDEINNKRDMAVQQNTFEHINKLIKEANGNNQIFIMADAGMGKTSLLRMLEYHHSNKFLPKSLRCELLKLGPNTLAEIDKMTNIENTILLLDSLDEDPSCNNGQLEQYLSTLLAQTKNFCRVFITCRTQFLPTANEGDYSKIARINVRGKRCPIIYLSSFTEEHITAYLNKKFRRRLLSFNHISLRVKAQKALNQIGDLQFRPMLLEKIDDILKMSLNSYNEFELYKHLVEFWLEREVAKLEDEHQKIVSIEDLRIAAVRLAEFMYDENIATISKEKIRSLCDAKSPIFIPEAQKKGLISNVDDFIIINSCLINKNAGAEYRFSHQVFRDFLILYGIKTKIINKTSSPFTVSDDIRRLVLLAGDLPPFHLKNDSDGFILYGYKPDDTHQLKNQNLINAEFKYAKLAHSKLEGLNLSGASMIAAELCEADLSKTTLSAANLTDVNAQGANLSNSRMTTTTILNNTDLRGTSLNGAELTHVNFNKAIISSTTDFTNANLDHANLSGLDLSGVNFSGASLHQTNFNRANLTNANFVNTNITEPSLDDAIIDNTILDPNYKME